MFMRIHCYSYSLKIPHAAVTGTTCLKKLHFSFEQHHFICGGHSRKKEFHLATQHRSTVVGDRPLLDPPISSEVLRLRHLSAGR